MQNTSRIDKLDEFKVIDEYDLGDHNSESIYLKSSEPIKYIKFYEYDLHSSSKGKLLTLHNPLRNGEAIKINTYLACGVPSYKVEYQRYDYIKGQFKVGENGKSGLVIENLEMKLTLNSIIYFLIK